MHHRTAQHYIQFVKKKKIISLQHYSFVKIIFHSHFRDIMRN